MQLLDYLRLGLEIVGAFGSICALASKLPLPANWKQALDHAGIMLGKAAKALPAKPAEPS